jgi:cation-transporting P-type ATPase E
VSELAQGRPGSGSGLSEVEAARRLAAAGGPQPPPSSRTVTSIVRENTLTVFNLILFVFLVVILVAGRPADALFAGVLVANTAIGIVQELRAKRTLDRAALLVAPRARAVRDGSERDVDVWSVVEGDLLQLQPGDQVVADGEIVEANSLMLDESPLTGESLPVERGPGEPLLSGSFAVEGRGAYVVGATGASSYAGRLVGEAREQARMRSPLELQINRLLWLLVGVMIPLGALFVFSLVRRDLPFQEAAATATAGIVTLVPEGLVLLTSLTFAVSAVALTRRGMLPQYLNAIESLAHVDAVCLDKTGTLTDGELELREVIPLDGTSEADLRTMLGVFAATSQARNDTLEAIAAGAPGEPADAADEVPFSSRWKWSAIRAGQDWHVLGAPDVLCGEAPPSLVGDRQREGHRVLVFGSADRVVGPESGQAPPTPAVAVQAAVVLEERLRPDAVATVSYLHDRGVRLRVMSGDAGPTVAAVAARAGIEGAERVVEHADLPDDDAALAELARDRTVFARLTPDDKRRLVDVLTRQGAYVAMIGDGVNDVPAMKRARLAIALGSGSQMAKSVADAVLVSDRFGCIPEAIMEGRRIIRNIQRVAKLFVTKSVFAAFVILTFGLFTGSFPLLPRHVTLAATFTIGIPGFLLALAPGGDRADTSSFLRSVARFAIPAGVVEGSAVIVAYLAVADVRGHSQAEGATTATTVFVAIGLYLLLVLDAERMEASRGYAAVVVSLSALLGAGYLVVLASPALRGFFALELPGVWGLIVIAAVTVAAIRALAWLGLSPYARPPATPPAPAGPAAGPPPAG